MIVVVAAGVVLVVVAVGVGVVWGLVRATGRIGPEQRQSVADAEARITAAVRELGGRVGDISRLELGTGAAFLSTDPHLEVRFEVHGQDPAALYEQVAARLGLRPAPNGATAVGTFPGGTRIQVVPADDHLRVLVTGSG